MDDDKFNARPYMELAISEMNKSKNEQRSDGKVPPKVGAILVFADGRVVQAHRGELREGDHAEFTLLERKLMHEKLDDCILFTTLEPCAERNFPKVACCKRTTNARIKRVFVGIEDPDPTVSGKGILHLEKHGTEVRMFDRDLQKIIEDENKRFLNQAIERKHKNEEDLRMPLEKSVQTYDLTKFSEEALQKFVSESKLPFQITDESFLEYLADIGAMVYDDKENIYKATGFGILLFGRNPRLKFPNAVLKASVKYAGNKIEARDFDQPLVLVPDLVQDWLYKVLPFAKDTSGFKRKDVPNFPIPILREAIINAIIHRDYEINEAKCSLEIEDNIITIRSPGSTLPAITLSDLNNFEAPSLSRNPILSYVFCLMDYAEEKGFGMSTLKSINKEFKLPLPSYSFKNPFLILTFPRNVEALNEIIGKESIMELNDVELVAFEIFRNQKHLSKLEFAQQNSLSFRSAERLLKKFSDLKLIKKRGSGKATDYIIID